MNMPRVIPHGIALPAERLKSRLTVWFALAGPPAQNQRPVGFITPEAKPGKAKK